MRTGNFAKWTLLTCVALTTACGGGSKETNENPQSEESKRTLVKTAAANLRTVTVSEEFTGTIQPYLVNKITPSTPMRIDRILVEVGDAVRKGQLLVEMDRNAHTQSVVQLENLRTDLERYRRLYAEGGISKQQLDQLETQVSVSETALTNLLENTELVSPINGIVTERVYDPGDMYSAADGRILTVMQLDRVKIEINISESYFPQVKNGMPVDVRLDVYPGEVFEGKVSLIHPAIDEATRTFTTEITIPNPGMKLRPGMFSRVTVNFGTAERVMVPDIAIQKQIGSNERYIFVVRDGRASRRIVTPGRVIGDQQEVLSGISPGEQVVIAGAQKLVDQALVQVSDL